MPRFITLKRTCHKPALRGKCGAVENRFVLIKTKADNRHNSNPNDASTSTTVVSPASSIINDYDAGLSLNEFVRDFGQIVETAGTVTDKPLTVACIDAFQVQIEKANDILDETAKELTKKLRRLGVALADASLKLCSPSFDRNADGRWRRRTYCQSKGLGLLKWVSRGRA